MSRRRIHLGTMLLALPVAACAPQKPAAMPEPAAPVTTVAVQNNYLEDMAIYITNSSGGRWRLGTVMRLTSGKLVIPTHMLTESAVQLTALPIGPGYGHAFPRMTIDPGSRVELVLERDLVRSNIWVR